MDKKYKIFLVSVAVATVGFILIGWRHRAATVAADFLDQKEIGNNAGFADKVFEQMMRNVGWKGGEAWCMYFVKSIYMEAFPRKADRIASVLTGSTQQSWQNAKKADDVFRVITDGPPRKGDIAVWQSVNNPSLGHAAIVFKKTDGGRRAITIDGNSGFGGTREGEGVTKNDRSMQPGTIEGSLKLLGFLRLR